MNKFTSLLIAVRIWFLTALFVAVGMIVFFRQEEELLPLFAYFVIPVVILIVSLPAFVLIAISLPLISKTRLSPEKKIRNFLLIITIIALLYALALTILLTGISSYRYAGDIFDNLQILSGVTGSLLLAVALAVGLSWKKVTAYFDYPTPHSFFQLFPGKIKHNTMETSYEPRPAEPASSNKTLIKGFITGGLILLMLIPTIFISNLVSEREARQKEIVKEVSSKWASAQILSCPFLVVPYTYSYNTGDGKAATGNTHLILLADTMNVTGKIVPEERPRSIYKVLLYRSDISYNGNFKVTLPADINPAGIDYANAKLCFTLSDFKGIEEDMYVDLNNTKLLLRPGLPLTDFGKTGLSVPVKLDSAALTAGVPFNMHLKLKGSEQLHFIPMSSSSKFNISSAWNDPSFDGEMLPNERQVTQNGFVSKWSFNQANLPFSTVMQANTIGDKKMDFGVSLVQPADQYAKTMRSVKYAILFIGLTFAFFFIIELMQKKPLHPVQYVLVGIALVIFYTLLLSISEYLKFDIAYIIASVATISLISLYAKGHFNSWKTAGIFFSLLSMLYAFIFVLIRLEDTALLVGSIGLFAVLALVMYVSRKINWYGNTSGSTSLPQIKIQ
ncbi:MAG: cell envelope integrity protein CreD [Ferruginibacter sp.]